MNQWLNFGTTLLSEAGIATARLDTLVLLADITETSNAHILAHPELVLTVEQEKSLQKLLNLRATHIPLAYLRKKSEFYGREFIVNQHVLVPRPESETIIELLKTYHGEQKFSTVVDIGTGSGALAITAALELPGITTFGTDVDQNCIDIAKRNNETLAAGVSFMQGDLFATAEYTSLDTPLAVLANLPYVPDTYLVNEAAKHEPSLALFGGSDGLDLYKLLFTQLHEYSKEPIYVFTESLPFQHHGLANIARAQDFTQIAKQDLIQVFTR